MLFNSFEFVFAFLPVVLGGFMVLGRSGLHRAACGWLALASLFFYGYWAPEYLFLLLASVTGNYVLGQAILRALTEARQRPAKILLSCAVALNIGALGYFKYANFFVDTLSYVMAIHIEISRVILPIGISFFTFTQIAYLVDTFQGKVRETNPIH